MKHLNILLVAVLFIVGVSVTNAQDQNNPWSIEVGVNAVDFFPIQQSDFGKYSTVETVNGSDYTTKEVFLKNTLMLEIIGIWFLQFLQLK